MRKDFSEETIGYIRSSQQLRMICRQMISGGYCLIVEDDWSIAQMVQSMMESNGMRGRIVSRAEDALTVLNEDAKHVICAVVDHTLMGSATGEDVVREIEHHHPEIPYVYYTGDREAAAHVHERFPAANVLLKGEDFSRFAEALGLQKAVAG